MLFYIVVLKYLLKINRMLSALNKKKDNIQDLSTAACFIKNTESKQLNNSIL